MTSTVVAILITYNVTLLRFAAQNNSIPLPERPGVYLLVAGTMKEVPAHDESLLAAEQYLNEAVVKSSFDPVEIEQRWRVLLNHCSPIDANPAFIVLQESYRPDPYRLQGIIIGSTLELGAADISLEISSIPDKQLMFKLVPKRALDNGIYMLDNPASSTRAFHSCFSVNASISDLLARMQPAKTGPDVPPLPTGRTHTFPRSPSQRFGVGAPLASYCVDYDACFQAGLNAFELTQWQQAVEDFQGATKSYPDRSGAWTWLGRTYLAMGRKAEFQEAWEKALHLGGSIALGVCRERAPLRCEAGTLSLGSTGISLVSALNDSIFDVQLGRVTKPTVAVDGETSYVTFRVLIDDNNYVFSFLPLDASCRADVYVVCGKYGSEQQATVAAYIRETILRLQSGMQKQPYAPNH